MSSTMQRQPKQWPSAAAVTAQVVKGKAFCSVCKNAGKSEYEYTNHYTKSLPGPSGVVVCPTILSSECSYCHKIGHFKNVCPLLKERDNQERCRYSQKKALQVPVVKKPSSTTRGNPFSLLDDSDDDSDCSPRHSKKSKSTPVEDFPPLSTHSAIQRTSTLVPAAVSSEMSYAERAAKPPSTRAVRPTVIKREVQEFPVTTSFFPIRARDIHHSWADDEYWCSSDDDDDNY